MSASSAPPRRRHGSADLPYADGSGSTDQLLPSTPFPLHQLVEIQARHHPNRPALEMGGERLTYGELDRAANRLARALRTAGCRSGDRVCFLLPKSLGAVVTILAVLKADGVYVPLDPDSPAPRLVPMIRQADPHLLVAGDATRSLLLGVAGLREPNGVLDVGWLGDEPPVDAGLRTVFTRQEVESESPAPLPTTRSADEPAYIFFTSGSTATPKGVVVTHANVYHFVRWGVGYFGIDHHDRCSGHAPLHFDLSTFDLFGTFAAGATLHLVPPELNLHPRLLAEWIRDRKLSQWFSVPTALTYMASFGAGEEGDFPSLKRVLWCGEELPTSTLIHWMDRVPHPSYTNLYGPTETTVASSYHTVTSRPDDPRRRIPIGIPCAGEALMVLNDDLQPVPPGEIGHLHIAGVGLSPGYWRDPEKTREAFIDGGRTGFDRLYRTGDLARLGEDGLLYFCSRDDNQVKVRGHRIEPGEVESALFTLGRIREAAAVAFEPDGFQGTELACAYVEAGSDDSGHARVRSELSELLPGYMLPSRWMRMESLPKNRNGKVDRPRLVRLFRERDA